MGAEVRLSAVLPAYNEAPTLERLLEGYAEAAAGRDGFELVLVDNGSTDDTALVIETLVQKDWGFRLTPVRVAVNRGYGHGILTGLEAASGEFLAWSHADLQCPPGDVFRLYGRVLARPSPATCFGKGSRTNPRGAASLLTRLHALSSRVILGFRMVEINAQPKLFHRSFLDRLGGAPEGYELDTFAYFQALRAGLDVVAVEVRFLEREAGRSKWAFSLTSRLRFMARNLTYLAALRRSAASGHGEKKP